jgi:non-heme chloroperoxidase
MAHRIYFKDWGTGEPVVFSHGWPLSADAWDAQMLFLGQHGYRVIAHDRRGHGRSGQSWGGNNLDTYADDLAESSKRSTSRTSPWSGIRPVVEK